MNHKITYQSTTMEVCTVCAYASANQSFQMQHSKKMSTTVPPYRWLLCLSFLFKRFEHFWVLQYGVVVILVFPFTCHTLSLLIRQWSNSNQSRSDGPDSFGDPAIQSLSKKSSAVLSLRNCKIYYQWQLMQSPCALMILSQRESVRICSCWGWNIKVKIRHTAADECSCPLFF